MQLVVKVVISSVTNFFIFPMEMSPKLNNFSQDNLSFH